MTIIDFKNTYSILDKIPIAGIDSKERAALYFYINYIPYSLKNFSLSLPIIF